MKDSNRALMEAASAGYSSEVANILKSGVDPNVSDCEGWTALTFASRHGHSECVRLLLPVSDPEVADNHHMTPLMRAAESGHVECVKLLLQASNANRKGRYGMTALMWAAMTGKEDCVRILLPVSDLTANNNEGETPHEIAEKNKFEGVAHMIKSFSKAQEERESLEREASEGVLELGYGCEDTNRRREMTAWKEFESERAKRNQEKMFDSIQYRRYERVERMLGARGASQSQG